MRKRYTYIPNSEIESLTTWNGKNIPGDKLLDGAYARGNVKYAHGGITKNQTIEQQAQELIGDTWFQMTDEQRGVSVAEFITSGVISGNRFDDGGTIHEALVYVMEEHQPNVDFYEDVDYLTIFSTDKEELKAVATYLQIPTSKIRFDVETRTYYIQVDKEEKVMAGGGGVGTKEKKFVVTFTVGGKEIKKNYSSQEDMDAGIADFYIENLDVENVEIEEVKKEAPVDVFKAAKVEKKKSSKKDDKDRVEIEGIEDDIQRLNELKAIEKNAKAEAEVLKGRIKELAREKFIEKYEQDGRRPDNFKVFDGDADILFIVQDNYIKVSEEKEALLKENHPELLAEKVYYKISEAMMNKKGTDGRSIGEILGDLIGRSRDITNEDKANLFTAVKEIAIVDGAIDKLAQYENIQDVYNLIQPIEALK